MQTSIDPTTAVDPQSAAGATSIIYANGQSAPANAPSSSQIGAAARSGGDSSVGDVSPLPSSGASGEFIRPQFGAPREVFAATARIAGRLNAAHISPAEVTSLLQEHQALVDKVLEGKITRREQNRLTYVRWSLDRIEDAKSGSGLDVLENHVDRYEEILRDMRILQDQLSEALNGKVAKQRKRVKR